MDILKAFKLEHAEVKVNISGTEDDPLFQANQIGEILQISNIRSSMKDFNEDEKVVVNYDTLGGNQQTTFLTEVGLYRLLALCRKPIARTFQKWVVNVVREIRKTGMYKLNEHIEIERNLAKKNIELERHNTLIHAFSHKRVVYFTKIRPFDENRYIIKVGMTKNIRRRQRQLSCRFGSSSFIDVFECAQNSEFETYLKEHPDFVAHRYEDAIKDDTKSNETYCLTMELYHALVNNIVKKQLQNYQGFNQKNFIENKRLDIQRDVIELLKLDPTSKELQRFLMNTSIESLDFNNKCMNCTNSKSATQEKVEKYDDEYDEEDEEDDEDDEDAADNDAHIHENNQVLEQQFIAKPMLTKNVPRANTRHRRVQQYNAQTFELVATYDGIMDVIRQNPTYSKFGIKNAAIQNMVYREYRWFFIDNMKDAVKYDIPSTKDVRSSIPKPIAMLNKNKTRIEKVFTTLQEAATAVNIKRKTTIYDVIKSQTLVKGEYYFQHFELCNEQLQNEYLSHSTLPIYGMANGTPIQRIDVETKMVIQTYKTIADVLKSYCMTRGTLKKACETGEIHMGYAWKYLD